MGPIAKSFALFICCAAIAACTSTAEQLQKSNATKMTAEEIRILVVDKTVNGRTDTGSNWVVYYDASGEVRGKANWVGGSETDRGTWTVTENDQFCLTFTKWQDGRRRCWELYMSGGQLTWLGKSGGAESGPDEDIWREGNVENL